MGDADGLEDPVIGQAVEYMKAYDLTGSRPMCEELCWVRELKQPQITENTL